MENFKLYKFETLRGKISFTALMFVWCWKSSGPFKMSEWQLWAQGALEAWSSGDRWLGHPTLSWGLQVSQCTPLDIRAWFWPFRHTPGPPPWVFLGTGTKSTFCTWKHSTNSAQCSLCVHTFIYKCINTHTLHKMVMAQTVILLLQLLFCSESFIFLNALRAFLEQAHHGVSWIQPILN